MEKTGGKAVAEIKHSRRTDKDKGPLHGGESAGVEAEVKSEKHRRASRDEIEAGDCVRDICLKRFQLMIFL